MGHLRFENWVKFFDLNPFTKALTTSEAFFRPTEDHGKFRSDKALNSLLKKYFIPPTGTNPKY
jgi:hypothetical protein